MLKKFKFTSIAMLLVIAASFMAACFGGAGIKAIDLELTDKHAPTPSLTLFFKLDKDLDLDDEDNNIQIAYFTVKDGKDTPIKNSASNGVDLVKDKGWAGFLIDEEGTPFVKGTTGATDYAADNSNLLKKGIKYGTQLRNGASSDGTSMEYHSLDWTKNYNFKVVITITTKSGKSDFSKTFTYTPA